jgi:uncharacterized RDD family membrane protein YckC
VAGDKTEGVIVSSGAAQIDSKIDVVTPENIAFRYQAAGPFRRLPAFLIDLCIRAGIFILVMLFFSFALGILGMAVGVVSAFVIEWFYGGLFETYWNGQTPGKRIMRIRVLRTDGQPIDGMQAVMRNILRFVDMMPLVPVPVPGAPPIPVIPTFLIGLITPMCNRRYQRLGDVVCGTMVVVEERNWLFGVAKIEDQRAEQLAAWIPANFKISRSLAQALATYVERRRFFAPARRREIARHIGDPLLAQFHLPRDTSHDLLLCALYYRAFIADRGDTRLELERKQQTPADAARAVFGTPAAPPVSDSEGIHISTESVSERARR